MNLHPKIACLPQASVLTATFLAMSGGKSRQEGLSNITKSYHLEPQIAIILVFLPHPCPLLPGDCVVIAMRDR